MGLRERNRRAAMRDTQRRALDLFGERGFEEVTVEEIARSLDMAPSTVFRHFGTKERLVLWDEHEAELDRDLERRLSSQPPLEALRDAFIDTLAARYDADPAFQLERVRFIYSTEALHAAAVEADLAARQELTEALQQVLTKRHRDRAPLLAGVALVALDVAIERWQADRGATPLRTCISRQFAALSSLSELR